MSKVFDSIDYNLFFVKLQDIGVLFLVLQWFCSYLIVCYQVVMIGIVLLECLYVVSGVFQGSILGLFFFSIYMNDLLLVL